MPVKSHIMPLTTDLYPPPLFLCLKWKVVHPQSQFGKNPWNNMVPGKYNFDVPIESTFNWTIFLWYSTSLLPLIGTESWAVCYLPNLNNLNECWINVYLYTAHITSCLMAVYNSIEWDRTSACEGATGCRYQSIIWSHSPTQPMHEMRDRPQHWELCALLFSISVWVL